MADKEKEKILEDIMDDLEKESEEKKADKEQSTSEEETVLGNDEETSEASEESTDEDDSKSEKSEGHKKGLFSKKEKKDPLKEKVDELNDRLMRQMAEFDNFRKRTDKEKSQMFQMGQSDILTKLLPVVDNFERGLQAAPADESSKAFADGMEKIYKQMTKMLEDLGVTPIEAVGQEFDPNLHNAVMQVESEEYEEGVVAQELQKGYKFGDTVLRHSMVAVSK